MNRLLFSLGALASTASAASFKVANDAFMYDDGSGAGALPHSVRSGSLHYHRAHPSTWADRVARLRAMGLNTIQTYVPWNFHSQAPGDFDFTSPSRDIVNFIKIVHDAGMLLLFRAGPYICGEHDFGGLPSYILATPGIASQEDLRTNNTAYMREVTAWWSALLPLVAPYTVANGGPIAMVQLENEYGSYGNTGGDANDYAYMMALRAIALELLPNGTQLYTTDGNDAGYLSHGTLPGVVFATGDGSGPPFAADGYNPAGWRAHTNSELYPGWLTHWGEGMANISAMSTVGALSGILAVNASFNLYMGFGGTNWGFNGGANGGGASYQPVITSYDYDAPVSEGGGHGYGQDGDKYDAIKRILQYWGGAPPPPEPPAPAVTAYGAVTLSSSAAAFSNIDLLGPKVTQSLAAPVSMESLGAASGYILYSIALPPLSPKAGKFTLTLTGVADYAQVFLSNASQGVVWRPSAKPVDLDAAAVSTGARLDILVESMGHINYGHGFYDPKGIVSADVNGVALTGGWSARPVSLDWTSTVSLLPFAPGAPAAPGPAFYRGSLTIPNAPTDSYIALCGWGKGQFFINGEHVGRFWAASGPQHSYYVPAALLQQGANDIVVFEQFDAAPANASISFVSVPDFTGAVCGLTNASRPLSPPGVPPLTSKAVPRSRALAPASENRPTTRACAANPPAGTNVELQLCSNAAAVWMFEQVSGDAGILQFAASPSLCAVQSGKNPTTGRPNIALGPCDATDRSQHWLPFPSNGNAWLNPITGACLDAENGSAGAGARVETYDCNGGTNQAYTLRNVTGGVNVVSGNGAGTLCLVPCA